MTAELCGRTAKTANVGITIRQIPYSRIILGVEDPHREEFTSSKVSTISTSLIHNIASDGKSEPFETCVLNRVIGKDFPNFEMLDAKIASTLNKIIQNSQFKKKVSLEEQKAQNEDRFLRGRQIAIMTCDYFRVTCVHDTVLDFVEFIICYSS